MAVIPSLAADPPATNPLFNDRKLKMGTFCTNLSYGCAASTIEGTLRATWPETVALAELADKMEFEALVPVGRWLGFGGKTNFNGAGFECYSWAAGISGVNKTASIFATSHVPTVHPVFAAKQAATIDHISGGRFTLNVVTGWYGTEFRLFGIDVPDHDRRYDMATEWVEIIRRLWTEGRTVRFRRRVLPDRRRRDGTQAHPIATPTLYERRRLRAGQALRRKALRYRLHRGRESRLR